MKILVTGAGGYIGSIFTDLCLKQGYEVVGIDNFESGYKAPLELLQHKYSAKSLRFYSADIKFEEQINSVMDCENSIEAVIHFAGVCSVDESTKNPHKYFETNAYGTVQLLESMRKHSIKNIVFSSSCAVYGNTDNIKVSERHSTIPTNPYGESKLMAEKAIQWYSKVFNFHYFVLRYFNVCGASEDGSLGDSKRPSVHLIQNLVRSALGLQQFSLTYPTMQTPDGSPIRDYVDVVDLGHAHLLALKQILAKKTSNAVINLGTGKGLSVLEAIMQVNQIYNSNIMTHKTLPRTGEYPFMVSNNQLASKILHWKPQRSLQQSIESLNKWYLGHSNGWQD